MARLIKGHRVSEDAPLEVSLEEPAFHRPPPPQPEVKVHRLGDKVDQIEVICSCGERIFIKLEYEGGSQDGASG